MTLCLFCSRRNPTSKMHPNRNTHGSNNSGHDRPNNMTNSRDQGNMSHGGYNSHHSGSYGERSQGSNNVGYDRVGGNYDRHHHLAPNRQGSMGRQDGHYNNGEHFFRK